METLDFQIDLALAPRGAPARATMQDELVLHGGVGGQQPHARNLAYISLYKLIY